MSQQSTNIAELERPHSALSDTTTTSEQSEHSTSSENTDSTSFSASITTLTEEHSNSSKKENSTSSSPLTATHTDVDTHNLSLKDSPAPKTPISEIIRAPTTEELELFQDALPTPPSDLEVDEFSKLAFSLSFFVSCLVNSTSERVPSEAEIKAEKERKEALKKDLLELVGRTGKETVLVGRIEGLLREWKGVHESIESWRNEVKGERLREEFRRAIEG